MPLAKCTAVYSGPFNDFTETYWVNSDLLNIQAPNNLDAVLDYFRDQLLLKRLPLLGKEYGILLQRATFPGAGVQAKSRYLFMASTSNKDGGDPNLTVVARCGDALNTRTKTIHMRGIWDDIEISGGVFVGKNIAAWNGFWNDFTNALITGQWGWYGKLVSTRQRITDIEVDANGFHTFTLAANLFTVPADTIVQVRCSKIQGAERLNTALLVRVVDPTHCVTVFPWATFAYQGGGFMRWNTQQLIDIANVAASRMGRRDAGKKSAFYLGRQKATPKG